ncbi:MAG TPA: hypothetical protein P5347_09005 [Smithellaceae bacterium]|mgnify:CR=1 FL=1|nr:hypothetical protein [Smithellaceae bacterium]HRY38848.1 hypothetical protein [Smithellaceae bacterium]
MTKLQELSRKDYFTVEDVAQAFGIQPASARVLCSRYVRQELLVRLKNNFYSTVWRWENFSRHDLFKIANILQVPSYISLMTALTFYDVSTQAQKNYLESMCLKRSVTYAVKETAFHYIKLQKQFYGDFVKSNGVFIATKEKAFLDAAYLYSFGKYKFDVASLDLKKMDFMKLEKQMKGYPQKTKDTVKRLCGI